MNDKRTYHYEEIAQIIGVDGKVIIEFINKEWLVMHEPHTQLLDEEDLARARFICELQEDMGVNDEAIPIILHLIDQLHHIHGQMKKGLLLSDNSPDRK